MRRSVGQSAPSLRNHPFSAFISVALSAALVLLPVLPVRAALSERAPADARPGGHPAHAATATAPAALAAPSLTATKTDSFDDSDGDGKAEPGQTITYTVTISNNGPDDATGVVFSDTVDPNTTLVPGSISTQPVAAGDAYNVVGNVRIQPSAAQGLLANDTDPDTGNNSGLTASGPTSGPTNGQATVNADGSFSYNPNPGFNGSDSFTYTVSDGTKTDTATVTLTVSGMIWFVHSGAPSGGDGRLTSPFNCLVGPTCFSATPADKPGDNIFLYAGAYADAGALTLLNGQRLIGQGANASTTLAVEAGVAPPVYSDVLPALNGDPSTVTVTSTAAGIAVAAGNTLRGFTLGDNGSGAKIQGSGFGTLTVSEMALSGTGQALDLSSGTLAAAFTSVASADSTGEGISLDQVAGEAYFGDTTITDSADTGVLLTSNSAKLTFADLDIDPAADQRALHATDNTGVITSSGGVIESSGAIAVEITGAAANNRTPLNVQLESLSANGNNTTPGGLVLTNTSSSGSPGGFRVLGTGATDGTGGTIQNTTTRGANINNAASVVLKNMNFTSANSSADSGNVNCNDLVIAGCNAAIYLNGVAGATLDNLNVTGAMVENGITAVSVSDFRLDNSLLEGCGNEVNESCVEAQNLSGTATVSGTEIRFSATESFDVVNVNTNLSLTISNSVFRDTQTTLASVANPIGQGGFQFRSFGTAPTNSTTTINVVNSHFLRLRTQAIQAVAEDDSVLNVDVFGNNIDSGLGIGAGIDLTANDAARLNFNVIGNPAIVSRNASAVNVVTSNAARAQGRVNDNPNVRARTGGSGLRLLAQDASEMIAEAERNTIVLEANTNNAIEAQSRFAQLPLGSARLDLTLDDNTTTVLSNALADINLTSGSSSANEANVLCANLVSNNASSTGTARSLRVRISDLDGTSDPKVYLQGFVEAGTPAQDVEATWNGNSNTPTSVGGSEVNVSLTAGATHPSAPPSGFCQIVTIPADLAALPADPGQPGASQLAAAAEAAPARDASSAAASETGFSPARGFFGSNLWPRKTAGAFAYTERAQSAAATVGALRPATARAATTAATTAATLSGQTVTVNVGNLPAGDSVTITFQVTVEDPFDGAQPQVSNQGTVTADGGVSVLTDDPDVTGAANPTVTQLLLPPTIRVNDATAVEPAAGSANALFTVTLSHPYTHVVTVDYDTAAGSTNPATAGDDYTATSGTVTFAAGETVKTISVPVLADGDAAEADETFLVNLTGAVKGEIGDGQAVGTITAVRSASDVIISELRTSGPNGSGDDFVELLNTTDADVTVGAGGWSVVASGSACADTPTLVAVIPAGTVIRARGNYLLKGAAYSLTAYAAGDQTLTADIAGDRNVGLFAAGDLASIGSANRLDAVGFASKTAENCDLLREGATLPAAAGSVSEHSFVRKVTKGLTEDTDDNAADFVVVSTTPSTPVGDNTPTLGAPGPEGSASPRGPVACSAESGEQLFGRAGVDTSVGVGQAPNTVRDTTAVPNGASGTLEFRRTFTNNTGAGVTALRFRVVGLSTFPAAAGAADLRALSSAATVVSTAGGPVTVQGTTLETPPAQALGGGLNSSLAAGTVTLATPLADGASVSLRFLFGVEQPGDYEIAFVLESSPASGKDVWTLAGHTEDGGHTDRGCNRPPVADAGDDQTVECSGGQGFVTLDGTGSSDPDGDTLTYEWKEGATVLGTTPTLGLNLPLGAHTITLTVTDPSGETSEDTVLITVQDTTPPQITCPDDIVVYLPPNTPDVSMPVNYTVTATDACDASVPVLTTPLSGSIFNVGTTNVTSSATDDANNTATCDFDVWVRFRFTGFFSPISNLPALNTVQAGRGVPVKFSLSGNKGLNIFAAGYPQSTQVACDTGVPEGEVPTVTAGSSSLTYDAATDQYVYIWKTESSWAGQCRQLVVKLSDGTTHVANFKFR